MSFIGNILPFLLEIRLFSASFRNNFPSEEIINDDEEANDIEDTINSDSDS